MFIRQTGDLDSLLILLITANSYSSSLKELIAHGFVSLIFLTPFPIYFFTFLLSSLLLLPHRNSCSLTTLCFFLLLFLYIYIYRPCSTISNLRSLNLWSIVMMSVKPFCSGNRSGFNTLLFFLFWPTWLIIIKYLYFD